MIETWIEEHDWFYKYIETSAKDNIKVEEIFNQMINEAFKRARSKSFKPQIQRIEMKRESVKINKPQTKVQEKKKCCGD